ncbi:MAG: phenylalanine 4-monooxygenase [Thermoanaerobaculia bacterium]
MKTLSEVLAHEDEIVRLDPDHPGFKDPVYRRRRNEIAKLALAYRDGDPLPHVAYTPEEQAVWRLTWKRLSPLHDRYACREWRESSCVLALDRERVPRLSDVNVRLAGSGFRMLPVAGLISGRGFLSAMAQGVFLSTQYMRHHSVPFYTPEPDVIHELVGHAAGLFHSDVVRLSRLFGEAARRADDASMRRLELVYWYTLEFGLVREDGELRTFGAGLLSSFGEMERFTREAEIRPLDFEDASSRPYDPTRYQPVLYVSPSFNQMVADVADFLATV